MDLVVCDSVFSRLRGLMFRKRCSALLDLKAEKRVDIHTLFVFFKIDVFWLDSDKRVVKVLKGVSGFLPFVAGTRARYVFEAPAGLYGFKIGEIAKWD